MYKDGLVWRLVPRFIKRGWGSHKTYLHRVSNKLAKKLIFK